MQSNSARQHRAACTVHPFFFLSCMATPRSVHCPPFLFPCTATPCSVRALSTIRRQHSVCCFTPHNAFIESYMHLWANTHVPLGTHTHPSQIMVVSLPCTINPSAQIYSSSSSSLSSGSGSGFGGSSKLSISACMRVYVRMLVYMCGCLCNCVCDCVIVC